MKDFIYSYPVKVYFGEKAAEKAGVLGAHANFAVLDPAYTMSLPGKQVISGAFDTLSHSMETYLGSPRDITLSDEIAEAVMRNVIRNIRVLMLDMNDREARSELMWASAMAEKVWEIPAEGRSQEELAEAGIQALVDFISKIGLPSTFTEMGITDKSVLKKVADTCNLTAGCCRKQQNVRKPLSWQEVRNAKVYS